jgi:hypothetical protein
MMCSFILALKRSVADVLLLWEAKTIDFDSYASLDIQLLVFCGVGETLAFLRRQLGSAAAHAVEFIEECRQAGDFDNMEGYLTAKAQYFELNR